MAVRDASGPCGANTEGELAQPLSSTPISIRMAVTACLPCPVFIVSLSTMLNIGPDASPMFDPQFSVQRLQCRSASRCFETDVWLALYIPSARQALRILLNPYNASRTPCITKVPAAPSFSVGSSPPSAQCEPCRSQPRGALRWAGLEAGRLETALGNLPNAVWEHPAWNGSVASCKKCVPLSFYLLKEERNGCLPPRLSLTSTRTR